MPSVSCVCQAKASTEFLHCWAFWPISVNSVPDSFCCLIMLMKLIGLTFQIHASSWLELGENPFLASLHTRGTKHTRGKGGWDVIIEEWLGFLWTHRLLAGTQGPTPCREGARWTGSPNRPRQTRPCNGPSTRRPAPQMPGPGPGTVPPATRRWRGPAVEQILPFSEEWYGNRVVISHENACGTS